MSNLKPWAVAAVIAAFGLVGLEVFARLWPDAPVERAVADAFDGQPEADALMAELYSGDLGTAYAPFVGYRIAPHSGTYIHVDDAGLRTVPQTTTGTTVIWMFGGSTLWGVGARDEATIPARVAADMDDVRVVSFAQVGHMSTQGVITLLLELQKGGRPDSVVFYDGVNEVLPYLKMGRTGVSLDTPRREREFNLTRPGDERRLLREALFGLARASRVVRFVLGSPERTEAVTTDLDGADEIARIYLANVAAVAALSEQLGFRAHFFWQPTVFTKRVRSKDEQASHDLRSDFEPLYAAVRARVVKDARVVDLSDVFSDDPAPAFFDFCHVSERGNAHIAKAMVEHMSRSWRR